MGARPDYSDAVAHIGDYAGINGAVVLLPESLRKRWAKSFGARELKRLHGKQKGAFVDHLGNQRLSVVDFDGTDVLVMREGDPTRFHPTKDGGILVRLRDIGEPSGKWIAKALDLDVDEPRDWVALDLTFKLAGKPALTDAIHGTDRTHMRFAEFHDPPLATKTYAIDVICADASNGWRELIRLRSPGPLPAVTPVAKPTRKKAKTELPELAIEKTTRDAARRLVFASTLGGPPVLLPIEAAKQWIDDDEHYDLACSSARPGVFEFAGATGVAFDQDAAELLITTTGALVMYRDHGDTVPCLAAALHADALGKWKKTRARFVSTGKAVLFDPVNRPPRRANVELARGTYRIESATQVACVDGDEVSVTLARLVREP